MYNKDIVYFNSKTPEWSWLSCFSAHPIKTDGIWPTAEHLYQAAKTKIWSEKELVRKAPTPQKAKLLGRKLTLRDDWEEIKVSMMETIQLLKFRQNQEIGIKLLCAYNYELVHRAPWDSFWGDGLDGKGNIRNELGKVLHRVMVKLWEEDWTQYWTNLPVGDMIGHSLIADRVEPCWNCQLPTNCIDINFQAFLHPGPCTIVKNDEFAEAVSSKGSYTDEDDSWLTE